ncbi:hypothetical protein, partial [Coxiella burnetii]|uniref:hypothetical protein n=1 Tax=Coxiella burnetii TaxID=777 RepID=UPI002231BE8A
MTKWLRWRPKNTSNPGVTANALAANEYKRAPINTRNCMRRLITTMKNLGCDLKKTACLSIEDSFYQNGDAFNL